MPTAFLNATPLMNRIGAPRRVLLILDAQICNLSDPPKGVPSAVALRRNISRVLTKAREARPAPLIIHVRNCGDEGEPDEQGGEGFELIFPPAEGEVVVDKRKNNAFTGTCLAQWIREDAEVVVVGLMSDHAIRATCSAAVGRGNEVILIREAHSTYDRVEVLYGGGFTPAQNIASEIEDELEDLGVHVLDMKDLHGIFMDR
ncbi:isochorismatase hydrolase [Moniliophthora roreri MCA 2997]|uniref:Isochorismatase hydrolase n=1 Tax=Moniliophthora roreri (strain MCA 2997) TaxID=1381753 RepID=V2X589_MONRO|nr:isochorismatase hydrolase [Moniliophthora roreri MCA 2997]KAI3619541.1 isochorismatase hydrolase [Moniliophthora roreri]